METYTIVWASDVQNDFAEAWVGADSATRQRLTSIANAIDDGLSRDPELHGESFPDEPTLHVWTLPHFNPKVRVVFTIAHDDRMVRVARILMARR